VQLICFFESLADKSALLSRFISCRSLVRMERRGESVRESIGGGGTAGCVT